MSRVIALAACVGYDPEIFFARNKSQRAAKIAEQICRGCPVRQDCLAGALARGERYGTWGGVMMRRRRPRAE